MNCSCFTSQFSAMTKHGHENGGGNSIRASDTPDVPDRQLHWPLISETCPCPILTDDRDLWT